MKHLFLWGVMAMLLSSLTTNSLAADAPQGRPQLSLSGAWKYQFTKTVTDQPMGQWQTAQFPLELSFPDDKTDGLWCEREVTIPADWQGRKIAVHIGKVLFAAAVYVNGEKLGELAGYGGEVDITKQARLGEKNVIRLFMGRGGRGIESLDKITRTIATRLEQQLAQGGFDWGARAVGVTCLPQEFYLESQPKDVLISDVWYRTYTRGATRIDPQVTINAGRTFDGLKAKLLIYDPDTNEVVRQGDFPLDKLSVGENIDNFPIPADRLKLWGIREPNMYNAQVILFDKDGKELDRSNPTKIGIREIWLEGKDIFLNGVKTYFVCDMLFQKLENVDAQFREGVTLTYDRQPIAGLFLTRNHMSMAERCDQLGMALATHGVTVHWLELTDPETLREYRKWSLERLKYERNHPSILFTGLGINIGGNYLDFSPTTIGRQSNIDWYNVPAAIGNLVHKELDPTRPTYFHGGPRSGDISTGNIYFNHIPAQESEDWLSDWAAKGDRPVIPVEFSGSTMGVDYTKDGLSLATEYVAMLAGDRAYKEELDKNILYQAYNMPRQKSIWDYTPTDSCPLTTEQMIANNAATYRAWRYYGAPVLGWYFDPDTSPVSKGKPQFDGERKQWRAYLQMLKPIQIWIGGPGENWSSKDHNFFAGDVIAKSAVVMRDLNGRNEWRFAWEVTQAGKDQPIAKGSADYVLAAFTHNNYPINFTAPEVTAPTPLTISLKVTDIATGTAVAQDTFGMTIYPRAIASKGASKAKLTKVTIIDPKGETTAWLQARGVVAEQYTPGKPLSGVLVIGREALKSLKSFPFTATDIAKGLRVVVFEQHCDDLAKLGFRHEDRCPRVAFVRQPNHPLASGITNEALRDWQGAGTLISTGPDGDRTPMSTRLYHWGNKGTVASAIIETPHMGSFQPIIDCEFDLGYTPLMTWRQGAGEIVFSQLDLVGRVGTEPAATRIADNLIRYLQTPLPTRQDKVVACFSDAAAAQMRKLGFAAVAMPATLDAKQYVVAVTPPDAATLKAQDQKISAFLAAGGDLLALYADQALLADPLFKGAFSAKTVRVTRAGREVDANPLLAGVGPQNIRWREPVDLRALESTDKRFTSLLGGLMGVLPSGKGRIVFFQVDPQAMRDTTAAKEGDTGASKLKDDWYLKDRRRSLWQVDRLHSALLTNLGVHSDEPLTRRLFAMTREMPSSPVNPWLYLGPFPAPANEDPLSVDISEYLKHRDLKYRTTNSRGQIVEWYVPTDSQNGMGLGGKMDMSRAYGVHLMDVAAAVTQIWSSQERDAYIEVGADWWLKVEINGKEFFRTTDFNPGSSYGVGFANKVKVHLKQGWNDVVCTVGAGTNGHVFWFRITNPGDLVVAQKVAAPADTPANLPPVGDLISNSDVKGFSLYAEDLLPNDDPYDFFPW